MMVNRSRANISLFIANHRLALWVLLLVFSGIILVFPVSIRYVYAPIQSASIFGENTVLFGIVYCIWSLLLFSLLLMNVKNGEWQRLALVSLYATVFLGFWAVKTPYGGQQDEVWNLAHVQSLIDTGKIAPGHPNLMYFQFPAFHLEIYALSQFAGMGLFTTRIAYLLLSSVLLSSLLYLLFSRILKDSWLASLAVILMLQGSLIAKWQVFWPGNLAFLLLIALLALLCQRDDRPALGGNTQAGLLVVLVLFAAFVTTYLPTPLYFISMILGMYLLQRIARKEVVRLPLVILFAVLFACWIIYLASGFFEGLASFAPTFVKGLSDPWSRFSTVSGATTGYVGESIPLWASLTRRFWLALIFGVGGILTVWNIARARRLSTVAVIETGGLLGILAFTAVIYLAIPIAQWVRIMVMAPLFTIPVIIGYATGHDRRNELVPEGRLRISGWLKKYLPPALVVACLVLSLPTFLAHETSFTTTAVYPYELSIGEYLQSACGRGNGLNIYSSNSAYTYTYWVPEAQYHVTDAPELFVRGDDLWTKMDQLESDFENSYDIRAVFVVTERFRGPSGHPAEIKPTDPNWEGFVASLEMHNRVYDDGSDQIYEH
jgi:hypothetical protein